MFIMLETAALLAKQLRNTSSQVENLWSHILQQNRVAFLMLFSVLKSQKVALQTPDHTGWVLLRGEGHSAMPPPESLKTLHM